MKTTKNKFLSEDELNYLRAKDAYYTGEPIMTDEEFDNLEEKLKNVNSKVINIVGTESSSKEKIAHITRMLSLNKIKAVSNAFPPNTEFAVWAKKKNIKKFVIEPKFDGNACNIIYKKGKLFKALTRGDGDAGIDITHIIKHHVPNVISEKAFVFEVRCEVLIKKSVFKEKYSEYKNPRNYVAGILHRDDVNINEILDLTVVPFEVRVTSKKQNAIYFHDAETERQFLIDNNFKNMPYSEILDLYEVEDIHDAFDSSFEEFLDLRDNVIDFLLDGFVIKAYFMSDRHRLGENSHDPEWAIAVKFEPRGVIATIKDIEWRISKQSELIPIAILEPIELDGTTIQRVSMFNAKWVLENKCFPGAKVMLVKKGDIIPGIVKVVEQGIDYDFSIPCPACGRGVTAEGVHLVCKNLDCTAGDIRKFIYGVSHLGLDHLGPKTLEKLFEAGITNVVQLLKIDNNFLFNNGFGNGRSAERILEQITSVKSVTLEQIILSLGISGLGETIAKQVAKMYAGAEYSFSGLEKVIVYGFINNSPSMTKLKERIAEVEAMGIEIVMPKNNTSDKDVIFVEATGSSKPFFKTKEEFFKHYNLKHESLSKDSKYLITDSYDSDSSKMKKAKKLGIEIITYEDFIKLHS